jgi:peptide-methionine (R)-S-oxide reductase
MKRYLQLLILPVIAFGFMACMKADKSEKSNCSKQPCRQELSLNDTSLTKVVKTEAEWEKALTEKQYYILRKERNALFKMNLMTTIKGHYFVQPASCLCLILKQNSIQERDGLVLCSFKQKQS